MANPYLTHDEILQLDSIYLAALEAVNQLRKEHPDLGKYIALPRMPNALSESIAARSVGQCFGSGSRAFRPPDRSDLGVKDRAERTQLVAVKGTGRSRWITITSTDLLADCLIWIDYSRRLVSRAPTADVWYFPRPVASWSEQQKLTFCQAIKRHGEPNRHFYRLRRRSST